MNKLAGLEKHGRIGVITIDSPPVNALSQPLRQDLFANFDAAAADDSVEAIVLACAGKTFVAGADLGELGGTIGEPNYHATFGRIENLDKPVVAAIHGTALGGGVELTLACHYRVASSSAKLGFPEINLGIVPGAGGTQRLPRLIGAEKTLELFLSGRPLPAGDALDIGMIDAITDDDLVKFAVTYAEQLLVEKSPVRRTSECTPPDSGPTAEAAIAAARTMVAMTMPNRQVPEMDINAVAAAYAQPFDAGIEKETDISDASLHTVESKAQRRLFFAERLTSKIPGIDRDAATEIASGGIIGAGTMGRGIAMAFANAGLPVTILDIDSNAVAKALEAIRGEYGRRVKRGRMTEAEVEQRMASITGSSDYADLASADVVIEAVFEDMKLKQTIFRQLDEVCKPGAILASNTSTLDILDIAQATSRPEAVVGLHFFSPAQVMPLLEIIRTSKTSEAIIATAMKLAGRLRKTGVLSANHYGFIGNRMMDPYGREAERMLLEGATPAQIDSALERFGMAMGILAVFDMAGVDVGYKVREERAEFLPDDPSFYRASALLVEKGMLGQKTGSGYYRYEAGSRERHENPEALAMFAAEAKRLGIEPRVISDEEIVDRCILSLINEGALVLEEEIALRASDVDVVYTSGYGFPRYRGGPMFFADTFGLDKLVARLDEFAKLLDPQYWQVSTLLRELANSGKHIADYSNLDE